MSDIKIYTFLVLLFISLISCSQCDLSSDCCEVNDDSPTPIDVSIDLENSDFDIAFVDIQDEMANDIYNSDLENIDLENIDLENSDVGIDNSTIDADDNTFDIEYIDATADVESDETDITSDTGSDLDNIDEDSSYEDNINPLDIDIPPICKNLAILSVKLGSNNQKIGHPGIIELVIRGDEDLDYILFHSNDEPLINYISNITLIQTNPDESRKYFIVFVPQHSGNVTYKLSVVDKCRNSEVEELLMNIAP